jgi:DNA-binding CsgD family transcriptional regulator
MTKYTPEQALAVFWSRVDKSGGEEACWLWTAGRHPDGYGRVMWRGVARNAHRVAYEIATGVELEGGEVCHKCDNPQCVNPAHLFLGTHRDNIADMFRKGRSVAPRGAANHRTKLTDQQVAEIRELWANGGVTQPQIARKYGITREYVSMLVRHKSRS